MTRWCLVVEDESPLGEMICDNLQAEGVSTELAKDGEFALQRLREGKFDLVILDLMLPGRDGFSVLETLRREGEQVPVLILSARSSDHDRIRGLELQADDYLTKPFNLRELMLRVRALLRRTPASNVGDDTLHCGELTVDFRAHEMTDKAGRRSQLSESEVRTLRLLNSRRGEVIDRHELVEFLFGPATPSNSRTLDNIVMNLRRLLGDDSKNPKFLHTVRGVGFRFTPE